MALALVCATTAPSSLFARSTLLGQSLSVFPESLRPGLVLLPSNSGPGCTGLPSFYNQAIESLPDDASLLFLHDDVFLHDWHLTSRLSEAFSVFDVVGLVGSSQVPYGQPGWWHSLDSESNPVRNDSVVRSGSINHFNPYSVRPDVYGSSPQPCDLIDGVFMAVRKKSLIETGVRFDPQFKFHCYDTDFCYSARRAGLTIGTWPIAVTHGSAGSFGSSWVQSAKILQEKLNALGPIF